MNKATRKLFPVAGTPQAILDLGLEGLEGYIKTIGLYKSKARHLMETLPHSGGAARRRGAPHARRTGTTARRGPQNRQRGAERFGQPTMAVDTHIFRVSNRTGLAPGKTRWLWSCS